MSERSKRVKTLLRVAGIRRKQAEAGLAEAERDRQSALSRQAHTVDRLAEATPLPAGTVSSLDERRQRTELRIDAVLNANQVVAASAQEVEAARLRWQAAARSQKSMEELDRRERAVLAIRAARVAERATDGRAARPPDIRPFTRRPVMSDGIAAVLSRISQIRSAFATGVGPQYAMGDPSSVGFERMLNSASQSSGSAQQTPAPRRMAWAAGSDPLDRLGVTSSTGARQALGAGSSIWPQGVPEEAENFAAEFIAASQATGVPLEILLAVSWAESAFQPAAQSGVGAQGLMQLMPGTAAGLGVDPAIPAQNIMGGARYLAAQYEAFGSWDLAFAAYNAGPGAVQQYGGIPPYRETQNYVSIINSYLERITPGTAQAPVSGETLFSAARAVAGSPSTPSSPSAAPGADSPAALAPAAVTPAAMTPAAGSPVAVAPEAGSPMAPDLDAAMANGLKPPTPAASVAPAASATPSSPTDALPAGAEPAAGTVVQHTPAVASSPTGGASPAFVASAASTAMSSANPANPARAAAAMRSQAPGQRAALDAALRALAGSALGRDGSAVLTAGQPELLSPAPADQIVNLTNPLTALDQRRLGYSERGAEGTLAPPDPALAVGTNPPATSATASRAPVPAEVMTTTAAALPERLAALVQRSREGGQSAHRLTVRLDPPDLGTVNVSFELKGDRVYIVVRPDSAEGGQLLAHQRDRIALVLAREGLELSGFDVGTGQDGRTNGRQASNGGRVYQAIDLDPTTDAAPTLERGLRL